MRNVHRKDADTQRELEETKRILKQVEMDAQNAYAQVRWTWLKASFILILIIELYDR